MIDGEIEAGDIGVVAGSEPVVVVMSAAVGVRDEGGGWG